MKRLTMSEIRLYIECGIVNRLLWRAVKAWRPAPKVKNVLPQPTLDRRMHAFRNTPGRQS